MSVHAIYFSPVNLLRRSEVGILEWQRGNVESGVASMVDSLWYRGHRHSQGGWFGVEDQRRDSHGGRIRIGEGSLVGWYNRIANGISVQGSPQIEGLRGLVVGHVLGLAWSMSVEAILFRLARTSGRH